MINNDFRFTGRSNNEPNVSCEPINGEDTVNEDHNGRHNEEYAKFYELIKDGKQPLYEGCTKYYKLSFLIKLYNVKCLCQMTDKAMGMILELLKDAFEDAKIPVSFYEAKKTINKLGLNYTKIHACSNDWIETRINRPRRVNDYPEDRGSTNSSFIFPPVGKGVGAETFELSPMVKHQAHRYVMAKGKAVDRGRMWTETHWRKDGSYVTEPAAKEIGVSILSVDNY
ncbi:hypothetical protein H5410_062769 [Solanum commersonii]|uniref:Uncharacterized protein n=1 Tax=Solanum commersonii TaxID=4109 RepID=A0A9J5WBB1_SOLCO|nr:hypothetical protein H5410_062769 [Solanum commersonii]